MNEQFVQKGGVRYGESYWYATNHTIPFAEIYLTHEIITVIVRGLLRRFDREFIFQRSVIRQLKWKRGLFSMGLHIIHDTAEYPPCVLFWTSNRRDLEDALAKFGFQIPVSK